MRSRDHWQRHIATLDPERDHLEIYRICAYYEFPWDLQRALELALYRTFAVPSIGELLDRTGEFAARTQRRYDDTALLLDAVLEHGYDSPAGRTALSRINRIHAKHPIANDEMLYVLVGFVVVPTRWLEQWGWRQLSPAERHATYAYYRELGRRMGIRDIPRSFEEMVAYSDDYEGSRVAYSDGGRRTAEATRELFVSWLPFVPAALVRRAVEASLDQQLRAAFGFREPPRLLPRLLDAALRSRAALLRRLPARTRPRYGRQSRFVRSYPKGFQLQDLGPASS